MGLRYGVGVEDFVKNPESGPLAFAKLMTAAKALREKFKGQMKEILEEEQYEKFEKYIDRMGQGMGPGRGQGFGPGHGRRPGGPPGQGPF